MKTATTLSLAVFFCCASLVLAQPRPRARPLGAANQPSAGAPQGTPADQEYAKDASTEINVKNADIAAVVKIFSKKTKRNYILDDRVKGKVSIYLPGKVSAEESLRILESVLAFKGFTTVPIGENLWKIVPSREAKQTTIPTIVDEQEGTPTAAVVTRLLPLQYIGAEEMKQLIAQLISSEGLVNAYTGTNSLILIDSEDNIRRIESIVHELDVPASDRDMTIIPVVHAEATDIADKLNQILGEDEKENTNQPRARLGIGESAVSGSARPAGNSAPLGVTTAPGAAMMAASTGTISNRSRGPKIIADERTNAIIVVADEDTTTRVRGLVAQLDSKVDRSGSKFYVYRCQHANAEDLAQVLSGLMGGSGSSSGGTSNRSSSTGFGGDSEGSLGRGMNSSSSTNRSSSSSRSRSRSGLSSQTRSPGQSRSGSQGSTNPGTVNVGEEMSITADPATNSLVIWASRPDYEKIRSLIDKLDIKRRQVLVEAMILEVAIDDREETSASFISSGGNDNGGFFTQGAFGGNLAEIIADPTKLGKFSVAVASSGTLSIGDKLVIPSQSVLMNAIHSNRNVNVLSSPNILTTDNEEAEIVVGQNVPFISSVSTNETNLNNTFNQIERQDVGITLRLTPQISSSDYVTLKIFTEVSKVIDSPATAQLGPTTQQRSSETTVIAKDAQMVVIGGLMDDDTTGSDEGVPYLKDVPVLGHLFKSSVQARIKRNLLIFITPQIIRDQFDARDATKSQAGDFEQTIKSREIFPDREDVLNSPEIDKVTESNTYDGDLPSTILPNKKIAAPAERQAKIDPPRAMEPAPQHKETTTKSEQALEFNITPEFSPPTKQDSSATMESDSPRASMRGTPGSLYLVMEIKSPPELKQKLPFATNINRSSFGISVPAENVAQARAFFSTGETYAYRIQDKEVPITAMGIFSSAEEALSFNTDLNSQWYSLSPYELMNLGKSPWTRRH